MKKHSKGSLHLVNLQLIQTELYDRSLKNFTHECREQSQLLHKDSQEDALMEQMNLMFDDSEWV